MNITLAAPAALGALTSAFALSRVVERLQLSKAKHPSLTGHARMSRRVARMVPFYEYDDAAFFRADGAPSEVEAQRRRGFDALAAVYATRFAKTRAQTEEAEPGISDLQFTGRYRVPFQFARKVRSELKFGSFVRASKGLRVTDLDDNESFDLTGSYGVNLFGYEFYKACIREGAERVQELGPVLGSYHPVVADNVKRLRSVSGLDEVSFHMSGTEAVMQAVRLARYHTGRRYAVRFCGAYHGWWGDVQPGVGNPTPARDTLTLSDMSERTLRVLRKRKDIACVLVNPLQGLHPNGAAASDSALIDSSRKAHFDRAAYTAYLQKLRKVCTENGIALIFDEVFVGFRLAPGGAQEYFGVQADLVTYGKTLGGGLPVGVLCGTHALMKRYRDDAPADICFARGTFNAHPHVMATMNAFLTRLETDAIKAQYEGLDGRYLDRLARMNARLLREGLPVRMAGMSSIWTVLYETPGRYNWLYQYYLRAEGIALSWVGTGRIIFSLDYTDEDFDEVVERFVRAARKMKDDGFFWSHGSLTNKAIKRRVLQEMLKARF